MADRNNRSTSKKMKEDKRSLLISLIQEELIECEELAILLCQYLMPSLSKEPHKTREQTGYLWLEGLMEGPEPQWHGMFRMEKHIFNNLCCQLVEHGLHNTEHVGIQEMVAMFLLTIVHGQCNRKIQKRARHSGKTLSRLFHKVLKACLSLAEKNIKPHDFTFRVCHPKIANDPQYWPFFKDAVGAIDSIHISRVDNEKYIYLHQRQKIMAVCDWNMCFTFVLPGWDGTVHDSLIFDSAILTPSMNFPHPPQGKYYLVDAAYPAPDGYLSPYRCERYHLSDFRQQPEFQNDNEVFNYHHSNLRCTIKKTFGVWKNRFQILKNMGKYDFPTQAHIVVATMAIHNFIRRNSQTDIDFLRAERENVLLDDDDDDDAKLGETSTSRQMNLIRDTIRDEIVRSKSNVNIV